MNLFTAASIAKELQANNLIVVENTVVSVHDRVTGSLALLFQDRAGNIPLTNPFLSDNTGQFYFYLDDGQYKLTVEKDAIKGSVFFDSLSGGGGGDFLNLKEDFGAVGDGVVDDTLAVQAWADSGGKLYAPRGLYRITEQIVFKPTPYVFGESQGVGTGGTLLTELEEADAGATVFRISNDFSGDSVFKFVDNTFKHNGSVTCKSFKIRNDVSGGSQNAHFIEVINGYDSVHLADLNLMFSGVSGSCLRLVEDQSIGGAVIGQTVLLENIVGIHSNDTSPVAPTFYMSRQQEVNMVGVKMFGAGFNNPNQSATPMELHSCRGVTMQGCSSALTEGFGIYVHATDRASDGISIEGHTFEDCRSGSLLVDSTGATGGATVSNINISNPRYQFPQPISTVLRGADTLNCEIDSGTGSSVIESGVKGCVFYTNNQAVITDNSGNSENIVISTPNGLGDSYTINSNLTLLSDSASTLYKIADGTKSFKITYSANTANDFGLVLNHVNNNTNWIFNPNGQMEFLAPSGGNGGQIKFVSATGNKSMRLIYAINSSDVDNGITLLNDDTGASINLNPEGRLKISPSNSSVAGSGFILDSPNGTSYTVTISDSGILSNTGVITYLAGTSLELVGNTFNLDVAVATTTSYISAATIIGNTLYSISGNKFRIRPSDGSIISDAFVSGTTFNVGAGGVNVTGGTVKINGQEVYYSGNPPPDTVYNAGTALSLSGNTFNVQLGTSGSTAAFGNHLHTGVYGGITSVNNWTARNRFGNSISPISNGSGFCGLAAQRWSACYADAFLPFTGAHEGLVEKTLNVEVGDIICDFEHINTANYSSNITSMKSSEKVNDKSARGVAVSVSELKHTPSGLDGYRGIKKIKEKYNLITFNALGDGAINVCNEGGDIEIGDLLCTSSTTGKAMKQEDQENIKSYTIAQSRQAIKFTKNVIKKCAVIYKFG